MEGKDWINNSWVFSVIYSFLIDSVSGCWWGHCLTQKEKEEAYWGESRLDGHLVQFLNLYPYFVIPKRRFVEDR